MNLPWAWASVTKSLAAGSDASVIAPGRRQDGDGVIQHRWITRDVLVSRNECAVTCRDAANPWRDQLDERTFACRRLAQCLQQSSVGAIRHEHTELATSKGLGSVGHDAQRGDGGRSVIGGRAGVEASGNVASRSASPTRLAKSSSTLRRLATIRARMPGCSALAQLEHEGVNDVVLLDRGLTDEELAGLAVVVGEPVRAHPLLRALQFLGVGVIPTDRVLLGTSGLARPRVRLVVDAADGAGERHVAVLLEVSHRAPAA